jgi:membrane protein YdbS with pleckstrin-like domain
MGFNKKLLNDFEEIVLDLRPHWLFFFEPIISAAGVLVLMGIIAAITNGTAQQWLISITGIFLLAMVVWALWRALQWVNINFVVTNDRLIYRSGIFAKHGIQIPLERVNNVIFRQNFAERIVGAGDLIIESAGQEGRQRFSDVRHPDQVQNVIYREMELSEDRRFDRLGDRIVEGRQPSDMPPPPPAAAAPPVDVTAQLERLEGLLQRGTITQAEFEAQKAKLLAG